MPVCLFMYTFLDFSLTSVCNLFWSAFIFSLFSLFLQCNRLEVSETELQNQVDDLNDKIEELEEQIRRLQLTEKQLRAALIKTENSESQLTVQLDNAKGDVEVRYLLM